MANAQQAAAQAAAQQLLDDAGHGGVIADPGAAAGNKARLQLPFFRGENCARSTRDFLSKVDGFMAVTRLTDAEAAQAVSFAMIQGSPAYAWLTNLTESDPVVVNLWSTLKPRLETRFSPDMTASERAAAVDGCKQLKHEDVLVYMDKCIATQLMLDRDMEADHKVGQFLAVYRDHHNKGVLDMFLRGLREEGGLKAHVNGALGCTTLAQFKDAATKYERHVTKQIKVQVAEVAEGDESGGEEEGEIANLKAKTGTKKKKFGGNAGGGGGGKGQRGKTQGGTRSSGGGAAGRPPPRCWTCDSTDHLKANCPEEKKKNGGQGGYNRGAKQRGGNAGGAYGAPNIDSMMLQGAMMAAIQAMQPNKQNQGNQGNGSNHNVDSINMGYRSPPPSPPPQMMPPLPRYQTQQQNFW